jgi:penicillin amidase
MTGQQRVVIGVMVTMLIGVSGIAGLARQSAGADKFKALAKESLSTIDGDMRLPGLHAKVTVIRDEWGVPHIYAQNTDDLFMAQGYVMAQDRLWQMEMWRRSREGRLAEILGPGAVARDKAARLLKYRGPMDDPEWSSYHPEGKRIFTAFAAGVNAYITAHAGHLPLEFRVTGVTPDPWTPETLVLRSATFGDATSELQLARDVARYGAAEANKRRAPDPWDDLKVPDGLDPAAIDDAVVAAGRGGGGGGRGGGLTPALISPYKDWASGLPNPLNPAENPWNLLGDDAPLGSNNWVVSGKLTTTGKPIVANDPHREVTNPSLRYIVHLNAPGWNVIGAGEAPFVGVALGHNDRLGWGLTIVGTDQEDVYVETVNPANPNEVKWHDAWMPLTIVRETINVKGQAPETIELKFSKHGPVFYEDTTRHLAYALKSALLSEPGTASYLAGLRLAQAKDCREFLTAAMAWKHATENLICGDVDGNISWQASALTPKRPNWTGRLPVPGDGRYEWDGYRTDLPRDINPASGFIATANNNVNPPGAVPVMYKTTTGLEYERITRIRQMITTSGKYSLDDLRLKQLDALNLRAVSELTLFRGWTAADPGAERARAMLAAWDGVQAKDSAAAALYSTWRRGATPEERDLTATPEQRQARLSPSLIRAINQLTTSQGADPSAWRWGRMHTLTFPHPFLSVFNLPPLEREGGTGTVAADGATYREVMDTADWERSLATNVPGQSGQPESPYYGNLAPLFAADRYFPLAFSRPRVEAVARHTMTLVP